MEQSDNIEHSDNMEQFNNIDSSNSIIERVEYNYDTLNSIISRDEAELIGTYTKFIQKTDIKFKCKCGTEDSKQFKSLIRVGALCGKCSRIKGQQMSEKIKNRSQNPVIISYYYKDGLDSDIARDKAILLSVFEPEFRFTRETLIKFRCSCGDSTECETRFDNIKNGAGAFCKKCIRKQTTKKSNETSLLRNPGKSLKEIGHERYKRGCESIMKNHGVLNNMQMPETQEKRKINSMKNHGVDHPMKVPENIKKMQETNIQRFNTPHSLLNPEIREKAHATFLANHGSISPFGNPTVREKAITTRLERYGVKHSAQCPEIAERMAQYKDYTYPSGNIIQIQGYENYVLDYLLQNMNIHEDDIVIKRSEVPVIKYREDLIYYPDIYIKSLNRIIEVKSVQTYKSNIEKNNDKAIACINLGYSFQFWIYDEKLKRTIIDISKENIMFDSEEDKIGFYEATSSVFETMLTEEDVNKLFETEIIPNATQEQMGIGAGTSISTNIEATMPDSYKLYYIDNNIYLYKYKFM